MLQAKTHWVWTKLAEETWKDRNPGSEEERTAGKAIYGDPALVDPAWVNRGYVVDAEDYEAGQIDLFEII